MHSQVYYIPEFTDHRDQSKFQAQIEKIFRQEKIQPLHYPGNYFSRSFFLAGLFLKISEGDLVFFIHPLYSRTSRAILRIARYKKAIPVCLVSDINALRDNEVSIDNETGYWKKLEHFIFQNDRMKEFVELRYGKKRSVILELFDLLFEPVSKSRTITNKIVFAGNTAKCPFIADLHRIKQVQWNVYSASPVPVSDNLVHFVLKDDVSDRRIYDGSFGLIWEGDTIENISNFRGNYLTVVTPLKLSNYLLNGLPVITSSRAAIADFVMKNRIGFCVDSLYEIPGRLDTISSELYDQMLKNVQTFSGKIASGYFTKKAVDKMLELVKEDQLS